MLHLLGRKNVSFSSSPSAANVVKKQFLDLPLGAPRSVLAAGQGCAGTGRRDVLDRRTPAQALGRSDPAGRLLLHVRDQLRRLPPDPRRPFDRRQRSVRRHLAGRIDQTRRQRVDRDPRRRRHHRTRRRDDHRDLRRRHKRTTSRSSGSRARSPPASTPTTSRQHTGTSSTAYSRSPSPPRAASSSGSRRSRTTRTPRPVRIPLPTAHRHAEAACAADGPGRAALGPDAARARPTGSRSSSATTALCSSRRSARRRSSKSSSAKAPGSVASGSRRSSASSPSAASGKDGRFAPNVGFELNGVGRPVDGCEVQASIGRTWPDRLHNRAAVEIPLTAAGRSYFADRQAARDLALFVRSRRMHDIRKEPANQAKADIRRVYGKQLAKSPITITATDTRSPSRSGAPPAGRSRSPSTTAGSQQNLKPYAFVF